MKYLALISLTLILAAPTSGKEPRVVPLGNPPVLDGNVDEEEWKDALRLPLAEEHDLLLLRDSNHLHLAVRSSSQGARICTLTLITDSEDVEVVHASYSLGAAHYERIDHEDEGPPWRRKTGFEWDPTPGAPGLKGAEARDAYLAKHGWTGSPIEIGHLGHFEFSFSLEHLASFVREIESEDKQQNELRCAFALFDLADEDTVGSLPIGLKDGTTDRNLQLGNAPRRLTFTPEQWVGVRWPSASSEEIEK